MWQTPKNPHPTQLHTQALENAFKAETIGLVTREEFVEKRKTLADRLEEEASKRKREAEEAAQLVVYALLYLLIIAYNVYLCTWQPTL